MNTIRAWLVWSAFCSGAGWVLSGLGQLHRAGYLIAALALGTGWFCWSRPEVSAITESLRRGGHRLARRLRRPLPLAFGLLALLVLAGGLLHEPNNGDTMGYRLPRVLHWLAAERWHWIHTDDDRMNVAAPGWEWLAAPLMLFCKTDRPLFLINWVSFLLLPGLTFSLLRLLGVRARAAWDWMWVMSSGYCFVMQAGSVCNDSFAAAYALAAVALALRGLRTGRVPDLWFSLLAAGLLSGTKQTNLPLLLPWAVAIAPGWRLLLSRPAATLAISLGTALVSLLPNVWFNLRYTGLWTGLAQVPSPPDSALWGILGNLCALPAQSLAPPIFPWAATWEHWMQQFLATSAGAHFRSFESFCKIARAAHELSAGLGPGICLLALLALGWAWRRTRRTRQPGQTSPRHTPLAGLPISERTWLLCVRLAPWLAVPVLMSRTGMWQVGRYFSAYYPLLLPLLLTSPAHAVLARQRWWRTLCLLVVASVIPLVVLSRQRPVWPVETVLSRLEKTFPGSQAVHKARVTFAFSAGFNRVLQPLLDLLPPDEKLLGYASGPSSNETALWRPFGSRRVLRIMKSDPPEALRAGHLRFIVLETHFLAPGTLADWLQLHRARLVGEAHFRSDPEAPEQSVCLIELVALLARAPEPPPPAKPQPPRIPLRTSR